MAATPATAPRSVTRDDYALFRRYPRLSDVLPRIPLGTFPTPVEPLARLSERLRAPHLFVKRDDLTSPLYGGNKVRKLELLLADLKQRGARVVMTGGGTGSNHTVATAAFAREAGLASELFFFDQPLTQAVRDNLLLDCAFGGVMHRGGGYAGMAADFARAYFAAWRRDGVTPGVIFPGGSSPLGTIGYVNACVELADQCAAVGRKFPHVIVVPAGSCGTVAGVAAGARLLGVKTRVIGVRVVDKTVTNKRHILSLARKTLKLLASYDGTIRPPAAEPPELILLDNYFGGAYGRSTPAAERALAVAAEDGLHLDPVYTGKAYAALLDYLEMIENREMAIVFWNTKNSVDQAARIAAVKYTDLPQPFHELFEQPLPTEGMSWTAEPVPLRPGMKAPEFSARALDGARVTLTDARARGPAVLVFSRYIGCPLCQMSLVELARTHDELTRHGARVFVFLQSDPGRILAHGEKNPFPFTIIPDPHGVLYDVYGVAEGGLKAMTPPGVLVSTVRATLKGHMHGKFEGRETQQPAAFVIDSLGIVRYAHYGAHVADSAPLDAIVRAVHALAPSTPSS